MKAGPESLRLSVHVVLETGDGKRLAEIRHEPVIHHLLTKEEWMRGDHAFRQALELAVVNPARSLVAAHVRKLAPAPFTRIDQPLPQADITLPESERRCLTNLLDEIARQGR